MSFYQTLFQQMAGPQNRDRFAGPPQSPVSPPVVRQPTPPPAGSPSRAPQPTSSAALRDIYRYFGGRTGGVANDLPFNAPRRDDDYFNPAGSSFNRVRTPRGGEGGGGYDEDWEINPDSFLAGLNKQYGEGTVTKPTRRGERDWDLPIDYSRLPKTRFGTVEKTVPVDDKTKVIDQRYVYDDPVYGRITHAGNVRSDQSWLGPILMSIVGLGAGSLVGAAGGLTAANQFRQAMSVAQLIRGLGSGGNPWQAAGGALLGAAGLPSWASTPSNMALNYLLRNRGRR